MQELEILKCSFIFLFSLFLFSACEVRFEVCCIRGDAMKQWKAQTVLVDKLEDHLNELAGGGYDVFGQPEVGARGEGERRRVLVEYRTTVVVTPANVAGHRTTRR